MTYTLQIRPNGNSNSVLLPKELMSKLGVGPDDKLFVSETPDGMLMTKYDPIFEAQMKVAEDVMRENYDVLRMLSKS